MCEGRGENKAEPIKEIDLPPHKIDFPPSQRASTWKYALHIGHCGVHQIKQNPVKDEKLNWKGKNTSDKGFASLDWVTAKPW